jgi:cytochrome c-type biogenesis protein CcmH
MESTSAPLDRLKRQLAQVDALIAEGMLKGAAARKARDDLERQVLALVTHAAVGGPAQPAATARPSGRLLAGVALFVLVFGGGAYALLGNHAGWNVGPGDSGEVAAQDGAPHATDKAQIEAMIARLAERLKEKPDDAEGWAMLGRSYTAQGRYADALPAYKKAHELQPQDAQAMADYADGLAMVNNRSLEGEPEKLVMQAIKLDPANVKALALAGTVAFNHADYKAAIGYWDRAIKASGPDSSLGGQLQGAIDEARKRAGLPPVAPAAPGAAPAAGGSAEPDAATASATVAGRVTLRADIKSKVSPDDTVFIYARAPSGSRMPLAILRKKVSDLPLDFSLDDSMSMSPAARLSSTPQVVVGARISKTGNAIPAPGDWEVLSAPVALGKRDLRLEIGEPVR